MGLDVPWAVRMGASRVRLDELKELEPSQAVGKAMDTLAASISASDARASGASISSADRAEVSRADFHASIALAAGTRPA